MNTKKKVYCKIHRWCTYNNHMATPLHIMEVPKAQLLKEHKNAFSFANSRQQPPQTNDMTFCSKFIHYFYVLVVIL